MEKIPRLGLFITGNDTDVGKTYVGALIAAQLRSLGQRVGVYKPVASGAMERDGELVSQDAMTLWEAAGKPLSLEAVCPQTFRAPVAPHIAAQMEGKQLDVDLARVGLSVWTNECDVVIVEGAGGLMSPIDHEEYVADLADEFGYPLVVVARNSIGAINQTLQSLITAECIGEGLDVAAVVLNDVDDTKNNLASETNFQQIADRIDGPILARVGYQGKEFQDPVDWLSLMNR